MSALHTVFGDKLTEIPKISTQEYFSNTFGASMILQTIMTLEKMKQQEVLPMKNYLPDPELPDLNIYQSRKKTD